jgi:hypothetical protein
MCQSFHYSFEKGKIMRISLVLIMVLTLATSAQAALSLSLSASTVIVGSEVTVSIASDSSANWMGNFILSEDIVNWTDPISASLNGVTILPAAGVGAAATPIGNVGYHLSTGFYGISGGVQFIVNIKCTAIGMIYIDLQDDSAYGEMANGPLALNCGVPEPMTIALLGLGGLFLSRRRKI